ncbi:MAG: stage 0 sporulation family protein [Dehalococcoidia bacterium]
MDQKPVDQKPAAETRTAEQQVVGIRYVEAGPLHYCSPGDLALGLGDYVVVSTDRGERLGWVVLTPDQVINAHTEGPLRVVDRLASLDEVERHRDQKRRAEEDITRAQAAATRVDPRVRVASLTYDLSGDYAELTFTAKEGSDVAGRVEREVQRALEVRDLLVEQVGDRDRAKALGGIGQCGRALCCSTWMTEFPAISIKMAKDQGLAPNPSKISGVCGRLLCCLSFEVEAYREVVGTLPKVGKKLTTPVGKAKVLSINALTEMVRLRFEETGQIIEISTEAVKRQMGTALRPEELDAEIEEALREKDRRRTENLVAALAPVDRPLRDTSEADTPEVDQEERARRRRERGAATGGSGSGGRRPRSSAGAPADGATRRRRRPGGPGAGGGTSEAGTPSGESRSGIRITRRRSAGSASTGAAAPEAGTGEATGAAEGGNRTTRRRRRSRPAGAAGGAADPRPQAEAASRPNADGEGGPGGDGDPKRRRRRGRRGGRRRSGGEGGGTPSAE